jgi:uncharacterized protein YbjT (DUF2867 family)
MILVTGATGNVGSEVVAALAHRNHPVRALARDPATARTTTPALATNVEVVPGDLDHPATVEAALDGVDGVFLLGNFATLPDLLTRMRSAGVGHVALLTSRCVIGGNPDNAVTRMWLDAEAAVRSSGLAGTILRPSGFHSNALRWLPQLRTGDLVQAPWPDVAIASIDPADIAAVAAAALIDRNHDGQALTLSGPEALTPGDQVTTLAQTLGRPLRYEPLTDDDARAAMAADTPPEIIDALFRFFADGEFDDSPVVDTVHRITNRPATPFTQWAHTHAPQFQPQPPPPPPTP